MESNVKLESVQQGFRSIPRVGDSAPLAEIEDVLGAAAEFSKLLRKLGIQQVREVREALSSLQDPEGEQIREAWHREQQRAAGSEQQLRKVTDVLISTFDILERMLTAFRAAEMEEWEKQTRQAIEICLHDAEKVGLVPLGVQGEIFDAAVHDIARELPREPRAVLLVSAVVTRGYALNGKVLRRAAVDYAG